jgi:excinuclease ABC subunit C
LVTHFGSVARLKDASVEEITAVPGIGVATANAVLEALGVPTIKDEVSMTGQGMTTSEKLEADRA